MSVIEIVGGVILLIASLVIVFVFRQTRQKKFQY